VAHDPREHARKIELTIAALRGLDRWGAKELLNAAFWGFKALPPGGGAAFVSGQPTWHSKEDWWEVLGVSENAPKAGVRGAYRALAQKHHPKTVVSRQSRAHQERV
jgi:DnaJ-domain-containing protein 1